MAVTTNSKMNPIILGGSSDEDEPLPLSEQLTAVVKVKGTNHYEASGDLAVGDWAVMRRGTAENHTNALCVYAGPSLVGHVKREQADLLAPYIDRGDVAIASASVLKKFPSMFTAEVSFRFRSTSSRAVTTVLARVDAL